MTAQFEAAVKADVERLLPMVEAALLAPLSGDEASTIRESMRYSLEAGGKRVRPVLCLLAAESFGANAKSALPCAVALEYIHTYSLIHDDLPAMDNDYLRRGKPTNHKVFGEGQAILAGDGLLTEAFDMLARDGSLSPQQRVEAIGTLAEAAGWRGMVGGQSLDLEGEGLVRSGKPYGQEHLQLIHRLKTGALLRASLELGGIAAGADNAGRKILGEAGDALGLAFQIMDDILDATSTADAMGKNVGKDDKNDKITYPKLLGLDGAKKALLDATERAICKLQQTPNPQSLIVWARYLSARAN
ncbi:MAG: polyprenyl synthetase family protein [Holophagales bacterium]|nr:polyprenyl synthetase family protein [Holophagales bacterium]